MVKVSIIVSIFNEVENLEKTFKNVSDQTLDDIELICITEEPKEAPLESEELNDEGLEAENSADGSSSTLAKENNDKIKETDVESDAEDLEIEDVPKTLLDILNEYKEQYDFIKVFTEENDLSKAYNLGINNASGEYIAFYNLDDRFIDSDALERLYSIASNNNADMASANIKLINSEDELVSFEDVMNFSQNKFSPFSPSNYIVEDGTIAPEEYGIPWAINKNIYKREFLIKNDISFPDLLSGQDAVFLANILSKIDKIYTVATDFYAYDNEIFSSFNRKSFDLVNVDKCNSREKRFDHIKHYKMVFDHLNDSKFDEIRHQFRFSMLSFIDMIDIEGGKDILDAYREVFKNDREAIANFEECFYFKHIDDELKELVDFKIDPENPRISVLIPVYNAHDFLDESINSLLNQTFPDFELVCVNDGSKDDSLEILNGFAQKDSRVKVFDKENGGCGSARNYALENAKGKYAYFFDPDDKISEDTFEEAYKNAIFNDSDMVIFKANIFDKDGESNRKIYFSMHKLLQQKNYDIFTFNYKSIKERVFRKGFAPWSKLYKKEFLDSYDDFKFNIGLAFDDVPFHVKSLLRAKRISYANKILYHYRVDNENSVNNTSSNGMDIFTIVDIVKDFLKNEEFYDEFVYEIHNFEINQILTYSISTDSEEYFQMAKERFSKIDDEYVPENRVGFDLVLETEDYLEFKYNYLQYLHEKQIMKFNQLNKDIEQLKIENRQFQADIKQLNKDIRKSERDNKRLERKNENLEKRNDKLKVRLDKQKQKNEEIMNSTSWKITKPLRDIKKFSSK